MQKFNPSIFDKSGESHQEIYHRTRFLNIGHWLLTDLQNRKMFLKKSMDTLDNKTRPTTWLWQQYIWSIVERIEAAKLLPLPMTSSYKWTIIKVLKNIPGCDEVAWKLPRFVGGDVKFFDGVSCDWGSTLKWLPRW